MIWQERFDWRQRTYVMGILNATPDSFSGDGLLSDGDALERAVAQARSFHEAGADIVDIGGESTRPGAAVIGPEEEMRRIVPVIAAVRAALPGIAISADTYRAAVAAAALDAGADIINDVWALRADPEMPALAAARGAAVILMHNRSRADAVETDRRAGASYAGAAYTDVVADVARDLRGLVDAAVAAGVGRDRIAVDPGIGFGKTVEQNLDLLNRIDVLKAEVGLPVLIGPSRKSFIGQVLDLPVEERLEGTAASIAAGVLRGADMVRVHDVREMVRIVRMTDRIKAAPAGGGG